ncbi:MAG: MFS transporter [bacterium]
MSDPVNSSEEQKDLSLGEIIRILLKASRGFWLINLVNFGDGISYFGILTLLTLFLHADVGFSDQWTGISVSFFTGAVTLFMLGGGFVSDKLGVRRALTVALGILAFGRIFLILAPELGMGLPAQSAAWSAMVLMALGSGIIQPALYAGAKEYTDPRTAAVSFSLVYAIMNLGIVSENFLSPFIRAETGIGGVFWFCLGVNGLLLLSQFMLFTRRVELRDRVFFEKAEEKPPEQKSLYQKLRDLPVMDTRFLFFIFALLPVQTLFAHQWLTIPHYIMRAYPPEVGARYEWISGINPFIIVIFVPLISALTRKVKVLTMMIIGTTISAAVTFVLAPGPDLTMLLVYSVVFSLGEAAWSSRFYEYVAQLAPPGRVGAYMGIAGIPWFLAKFTTGFYSGYMLERFCPEGGPFDTGTMWLLYGLIACTSPLILILGRKWVEKGVPEVQK